MTTGIYKITNKINGKAYVGQSIHIELRWREHGRPSNSGAISKAIQKYGRENFTFEILEVCELEELDKREEYYINLLGTGTPHGYNIELLVQGRSVVFNRYDQEIFNEILKDIKEDKLSFNEIGNKYELSTMTIYRLNSGESHKMPDEKYPLREVLTFTPCLCETCGKKISRPSKNCKECSASVRAGVVLPEPLELARLIIQKGVKGTGSFFGVSREAIIRWCKNYKIPHILSELTRWYEDQLGIERKEKKIQRKDFSITQKSLSGEILNKFNTHQEAALYLIKNNLVSSSSSLEVVMHHISRVAYGKRKTGYKFLWEWNNPNDI